MSLDGRVAVVTGATKGVGRGIGRALAQHGARVFITGRSAPDHERLDGQVTSIRCDHRVDTQVEAAFQLIVREADAIDMMVNISFWAAQKHIGNVAYGVSKAATDKMTADMATELKPYGVAVVSLYPGLVRTEKVMESAKWLDLTNSESPEFIGRAVAALAADPHVLRYTGKVLVAAGLAMEYGFTDIDGKTPRPLTLTDV